MKKIILSFIIIIIFTQKVYGISGDTINDTVTLSDTKRIANKIENTDVIMFRETLGFYTLGELIIGEDTCIINCIDPNIRILLQKLILLPYKDIYVDVDKKGGIIIKEKELPKQGVGYLNFLAQKIEDISEFTLVVRWSDSMRKKYGNKLYALKGETR